MTPFPNKSEEEACLRWAVGSDYRDLPLQRWDERIRARTGLNVQGSDEVEESLHRVYTVWVERDRPNWYGPGPLTVNERDVLDAYDRG